jgi:hypothetical protein
MGILSLETKQYRRLFSREVRSEDQNRLGSGRILEEEFCFDAEKENKNILKKYCRRVRQRKRS